MNKRIKELAEQAGASIEENTLAFPVVFGEMEDFEKFAELIAAEVINKASISNGHGNNQWDKALIIS